MGTSMINGSSSNRYDSHMNIGTGHEDVVELAVLMCGEHVRALEQIAEAEGLSIAGLIRRAIRTHLAAERDLGGVDSYTPQMGGA